MPPDDPTRTARPPSVSVPDDTATSVRSLAGGPPPPTTVSQGQVHTPRHAEPAPPPVIPGYECVRPIAEGGMGSVYLYRDLGMRRAVAVKVLKLHGFDVAAARGRFAREIRTTAAIEHPNLVPVHHSGEADGVPYYVMKFMTGGTLPAAKAGRRYEPGRAAELLRDVARGVAALHARGTLHRDLKPSNILLDDAGVPHVADFGLAKCLDENEHTQSFVLNGTPPYMSPEQVAGRSRRLTPTCDVWALGVIGYELVAGRRPFDVPDDEDDREELFRQIRHDPPPPLAGVPVPLVEVLFRCLDKDPLRRYPTAAELADDLEAFLAGRPVAAAVDTTVTLPPPRSRRTFLKAVFGATAAAASAGVGYALLRDKTGDPPIPPIPPIPPVPSFADRVIAKLKAGETVELVGETGSPNWSRMVPPECLLEVPSGDGTFTVKPNPNGPTLHPLGWLELFADPIPVPYRIEGEICYRELPDAAGKLTAQAGLYLGRRTWPSAGGPWRTAALVRHTPPHLKSDESIFLDFAAGPEKEGMLVVQQPIGERKPRTKLPGGAALNRWVSLNLEHRSGVLAGGCDGVPVVPLRPYNGPGLRKSLPRMIPALFGRLPKDDRPPSPALDPAEPLFGGGLGLFVRAATVSLRHVRVVPLPPEPAGDP